MEPIRVVVHGALGKMGREVMSALYHEPGIVPVGAVDAMASRQSLLLPDNSGEIPLSTSLDAIINECRPAVVVDFTRAAGAMAAARAAAKYGIRLVSGSTGLTEQDIEELKRLAADAQIGMVVAPNFALGAVLMMHLAKIAGKYLDTAEIIELHHDQKLDAPSGTALTTAHEMVKARGKPFRYPAGAEAHQPESRGQQVGGIAVHSVRLPGLVAHQEIIFGAAGQTLSIRHNSTSRESFMPGVIMAVKEVTKRRDFVYGLDSLLNL